MVSVIESCDWPIRVAPALGFTGQLNSVRIVEQSFQKGIRQCGNRHRFLPFSNRNRGSIRQNEIRLERLFSMIVGCCECPNGGRLPT